MFSYLNLYLSKLVEKIEYNKEKVNEDELLIY